MNVPGRAEGNWSWRAAEEMLSDPAFEALRELTNASRRLGLVGNPPAGGVMEAAS